MSGAAMDYRFGSKRNWRRWVWNRIEERVQSPRDSLCFYLPGANDFDREIALSRGFRRENLIGVERDKNALRSIREDGALSVSGDLISAVNSAIAARLRISAVLGDFCGGLDRKLSDSMPAWFVTQPQMLGAVFAFNFLRGRDAASNPLRKGFGGRLSFGNLPDTHRGKLFLEIVFLSIGFRVVASRYGLDLLQFARLCDMVDPYPERMDYLARSVDVMVRNSSASFYSYKSTSGQFFDSVVFTNPFSFEVQNLSGASYAESVRVSKGTKERRSLAAVMAHRTMRMKASQ